MRYCPQCRSEYRDGIERCADCGATLVAERPPAAGWQEIFTGDALKADIVRSALESAGIETIAPDDMVSNLGWYAPESIGRIRLLVRNTDFAAAREVIAELDRPEPAPPPDGSDPA